MSLDQLPSVLIALLMHGLPSPARFIFARSCKSTYAAADCAFAFKHADPLKWVMRRSSPSIVQRRSLRFVPALRVDWLDNAFSAEERDLDRLLELGSVVPIIELRVLPTRVVSTPLLRRLLQSASFHHLRMLSLRTLPDEHTDLVSALPSLESLDLLSLTIPFAGFNRLTPSLTSLTASGHWCLLPSLDHCPRLLSLAVHWPQLDSSQLFRFAQQPVLRQLRSIALVHWNRGESDLDEDWGPFFENALSLLSFEMGDWPVCAKLLGSMHRAPALRLLRIRKKVAWRASDLRALLLAAPSLRVELADLREPWPSAPAQERKEWKRLEADVADINAVTDGRVTMVFEP